MDNHIKILIYYCLLHFLKGFFKTINFVICFKFIIVFESLDIIQINLFSKGFVTLFVNKLSTLK